MRILITGGAGFVGSRLARIFRKTAGISEVVALDNLRRRGSELNLEHFRKEGITFRHGDIRSPSDLQDLEGDFDVMIDASAEPSVHAGVTGSPDYVIDTNLGGTIHCLDFARKRCGAFIFLSTSRVYSLAPLRAIPLREEGTRLALDIRSAQQGLSETGIHEDFPTNTARSLYGATKLASELLVQEYAHAYGLKAVINRCGVIAGAGQFGKTDQGVFTLWVANHHFGIPLSYTGFGGKGLQVRDLLHPDDLFALVQNQLKRPDLLTGDVFNAGGGLACSVSLQEMTVLCQKATGRSVSISENPATAAVDVPWYATDNSKAQKAFGWLPGRSPEFIVNEIAGWIRNNEASLAPLFGK
jgi:CDP-paratose 2-epimerase